MGHRLSKIYTKTGDNGTTGLGDGSRIAKDDARVEAFGTIDELNSLIGLVIATPSVPTNIQAKLIEIQHDLFDLGGELCIPGYTLVDDDYTSRLESFLDDLNEHLPPLKEFILPGGNEAAAKTHFARTVCRRAERRLITLHHEAPINPSAIKYVNRLSDLLFVIARTLARQNGGQEVLWQRKKENG